MTTPKRTPSQHMWWEMEDVTSTSKKGRFLKEWLQRAQDVESDPAGGGKAKGKRWRLVRRHTAYKLYLMDCEKENKPRVCRTQFY